MKDDPPPDSKSLQERFNALGKEILAVPRAVVEARDKKWHAKKQRQKQAKRP